MHIIKCITSHIWGTTFKRDLPEYNKNKMPEWFGLVVYFDISLMLKIQIYENRNIVRPT